jgi:betaine-aldehyde dehydrogenase
MNEQSLSDTGTESAVRSFDRLFIGGQWVEPATSARIEIVSPVTGAVVGEVPLASREDADAAVAAARRAFDEGPWPRTAPVERAVALRRVAEEIRARREPMARSFSAEVGYPLAGAEAWIEAAAGMWEEAAALAESFAFDEPHEVASGTAIIRHEPVGVVAAITPWNNPIGNASLKIAPALAAGCTVVSKPAVEGPSSTFLLAEAIEAAGLPAGVVSILPGDAHVGEQLVTHPGVDKVAFTGSTAAGKRIMSLCGDRLARLTLELGGKSAAIIADDIDVERFADEVVSAGIAHSGQICAALTRVLVPRDRHDEIVARLAASMDAWTVGDPGDPGTRLGPLVAERQLDRVNDYIRIGVEEGATLVRGGARPEGVGEGWFVEPTLFANVDNTMRIAREEIFGPVMTVIPFDTVEEAVAIANDSPYGLSGAVYADDPETAEYVADRVRTGQMWINTWGMSTTVPFGGFKQSGFGREGGMEGFSAYLESKYIHRAS